MLRINLLATKAARKHDSARQEMLAIVGLILLVAAGLYGWNWSLESQLDDMRGRIAEVRAEMSHLKQDVVRVEEFKKKADTLESKIKVITDLQKKRVGPAHMLDDLATIVTEQPKVWLTQLAESGGTLTLEGGAMEHENLSDFELALERQSKLFHNPTLEYVRGKKSGETTYFEWKIVCKADYVGG